METWINELMWIWIGSVVIELPDVRVYYVYPIRPFWAERWEDQWEGSGPWREDGRGRTSLNWGMGGPVRGVGTMKVRWYFGPVWAEGWEDLWEGSVPWKSDGILEPCWTEGRIFLWQGICCEGQMVGYWVDTADRGTGAYGTYKVRCEGQ